MVEYPNSGLAFARSRCICSRCCRISPFYHCFYPTVLLELPLLPPLLVPLLLLSHTQTRVTRPSRKYGKLAESTQPTSESEAPSKREGQRQGQRQRQRNW